MMRLDNYHVQIPLIVAGLVLVVGIAEAQPGKSRGKRVDSSSRADANGAKSPGTQRPDRKVRADALVRVGNDYFRKGQFDKAKAAYEQAIRYHYEPGYEYNLALTCHELGKLGLASMHFANALRSKGIPLTARERTRATEFVENLRERTGTIELVCDSCDGVVLVDDRRIALDGGGRGRTVVSAGEVRIVARRSGYESFSEVVRIDAGAVSSQGIRLKKTPARLQQEAIARLQRERDELRGRLEETPRLLRETSSRGKRKRMVGIALMIAGGVAAGTGVGYGLSARRANDRARILVELGEWEPPVSDVVNQIGKGANVGVAAGSIAGAVLFGAGGVMYLLGRRDSGRARNGMEERFSVVPYGDGESLGIQLHGGF